jgi:hypothetical protein
LIRISTPHKGATPMNKSELVDAVAKAAKKVATKK